MREIPARGLIGTVVGASILFSSRPAAASRARPLPLPRAGPWAPYFNLSLEAIGVSDCVVVVCVDAELQNAYRL